MRKYCLILSLLSLSSCVVSQQNVSQKFGETITAEDLKKHLTFIASDSLKGRDTGSPEQRVAAQYIADHFKNCGLKGPVGEEGSYLQLVDLVKRTWGDFYLKINGKKKKYLDDFTSQSLTPIPNEQNLEVVFAGFGIEEGVLKDYEKIDVKNKWVAVFEDEPKTDDGKFLLGEQASKWGGSNGWKEKVKLAKEKGALGMLVISKRNEEDYEKEKKRVSTMIRRFGNARMGFRDQAEPQGTDFAVLNIPVSMAMELFKITTETELMTLKQNVLVNRKSVAGQLVSQQIDVKIERKIEGLNTFNVLGFLEGTDKKDEIVIVTSHYDHVGMMDGKVYNGADDDGSGTVSVLEMAEAFGKAATEGIKPRRSILFMTVTGEEKGLLGSEYYVNHPIFALNKTVCDLNIDMVGRTDPDHEGKPDYVYVIGSDKLSSELHTILGEANQKTVQLDLDFKFNDPNDPNRFYYRSDHYNFAKNKIPVAFFFNGVHKDYHQPTDDIDKIEFPKMEKRARLVFSLAWELANREKRILVDSNKQ